MGWRLKFRHATIQVRGADSTTLSSPSLSSFRVCSMHAHWGSAWSFVRCPLSLSLPLSSASSLSHTHTQSSYAITRKTGERPMSRPRSLTSLSVAFYQPRFGMFCGVMCSVCVCACVYPCEMPQNRNFVRVEDVQGVRAHSIWCTSLGHCL